MFSVFCCLLWGEGGVSGFFLKKDKNVFLEIGNFKTVVLNVLNVHSALDLCYLE